MNMNRLFLTFISCLFLVSGLSQTQPVLPATVYRSIGNSSSHLAQSGKIVSMVPGQYGYLWLATNRKVYRYNYHSFEEKNMLYDTTIYKLQVLYDSILLILYQNGHTSGIHLRNLRCLNTDSLLGLNSLPADKKKFSCIFSRNGKLLLVKKKYTADTGRIPYVVLVDGTRASVLKSRAEAELWLRSIVFNGNKHVNAIGLFDDWITSLSFLGHSNGYVFIGRQLYAPDGSLVFDSKHLGEEKVVSSAVLNRRELWLGFLNGGLLRIKNYSDSGLGASSVLLFEDHLINGMQFDYQNNLWINSFDNGLSRVNAQDLNVLYYEQHKLEKSLKKADILKYYAPQKLLTYSRALHALGLHEGEKSTTMKYPDTLQHIVLNRDHIYSWGKSGIWSQKVQGGVFAAAPALLSGSPGKGAIWKDVVLFRDNYYGLLPDKVYTVSLSGKVEHYRTGLPEAATTLQPLPDSSLLIGTKEGIYKDGMKLPLLTDAWFSKIRLVGNDLFYCTNTGLYSIPLKELANSSFLRQLSSSPILDIKVDSAWIFFRTGHGMLTVDRTKKVVSEQSFLNYTIPFTISDYDVTDKHLVVSGDAGLFYFPKHFFSDKSVPPRIHILNSLNNNIPGDSASECYKGRHITFTLDILDAATAKEIQFRILKDGASYYDWTKIDHGNFPVRLDNTAPGLYRIQYKVRSLSGTWESTYSYYLTVKSIWWQTWWFITVSIVLLLTLFSLMTYRYVRYSIRKEREKSRIAIQIKELEAQTLINQLDSHFVFNSLVPFQHYILKGDSSGALDYIREFSVLIRSMLKISRSKTASLETILTFLRQYLSIHQKIKGNFDFSIEVRDIGAADQLYIPALLLQPIVENAIEHGIKELSARGSIKILVSPYSSSLLQVDISDNGKGYDPQKIIKPDHAIQIVRERLALMQPDSGEDSITFTINPDGGTTVKIRLPYTKNID